MLLPLGIGARHFEIVLPLGLEDEELHLNKRPEYA